MIRLNISKAIIRLRKEHGLEQKDLAERSGLSQRYIIELESGKPTSIKYAAKLAAALEVPLNEIWHKPIN